MQTSVHTPHKPTEVAHDGSTEKPSKAEIEAVAGECSDSGRLLDCAELPHVGTANRQKLRLIECPACGKDLLPNGGDDLSGHSGVAKHIAEHLPQDFGLTPKREAGTLGGESNAD